MDSFLASFDYIDIITFAIGFIASINFWYVWNGFELLFSHFKLSSIIFNGLTNGLKYMLFLKIITYTFIPQYRFIELVLGFMVFFYEKKNERFYDFMFYLPKNFQIPLKKCLDENDISTEAGLTVFNNLYKSLLEDFNKK